MSLDPAKLTTDLTEDYSSYLRSRFFFRDERLREQFARLLEGDRRLWSGPFIELTPPFKEGATPRKLVERGILSTALMKIPAQAMYPDRLLYLHQDRAIEKVQAGRNVIVATGTGSGKTETYLLPILSNLLSERATNKTAPL